MSVKSLPEGYHAMTPYFQVKNADRLIDFLVRVFDAKKVEFITSPKGTILHSELKISDSMIMISDAMETMERPLMPGAIYFYTEDVDSLYRRAIEGGATSIMEPADQFYGDRVGGVKDPTGGVWWIAKRLENISPEELQKRADNLQQK